MRTKLYNLMAWIVCLTMASCTNQEIIEQAIKPVHSNTLNVLTEKQESRSVLSYEGTFYWTENDYIGVYGTETENARFHFTSQTDGISTFTGNMNASEEKVSWAYFPYSEKVDVTKKQLSFPMPAERTVSNENHSPMIGRVEANNTVRFYHTGGILYLKIVGLPEHAVRLVITSEGENSPYLAGTAVIDDITADGCTYHIDNGSKEVVYDVRNLKGGEYIHAIYLPLQVGTYEKIKVALKNEVGGIIKERSLSNLVVTRGKMTDTPTLHFSELLYAYEIPKDLFIETGWSEAYIFSNQLLVGCEKNEDGSRMYTIANMFDFYNNKQNVANVYFDKSGYITSIMVDNSFAFINYGINKTADVVFISDNEIQEFSNLSLDYPVQSRAVEGGVFFEDLAGVFGSISSVLGIPGLNNANAIIAWGASLPNIPWSDNRNIQLVGAGTLSILAAASTLVCLPATLGTLGTVAFFSAAYGIVSGVFSLAAATQNVTSDLLYQQICGNLYIETLAPERIDGYDFRAGYVLHGTEAMPVLPKLPDWLGIKPEAGLIIRSVDIGENQPDLDVRYTKKLRKDLTMLKIDSSTPIEDKFNYRGGRTYIVRSYIQASSKYPIVYYGEPKSITFGAYIENVSVEPGVYSDGRFTFKINVVGNCYDNTKAWSMNLYRNDKLFDSKVWTNDMNDITFEVQLDKKEMHYQSKETWTWWDVGITSSSDINNEPISSEYIGGLEYNEDPKIDLDVRIIPGYPRKINNSRAADDDDEEKWIVKYEVTAKTKGSGWIEQVVIKESGHPVKTGNPKNEGDSFTYTGSKTYKDKSELPTISCDAILINGAGNKQSVPASINIASKL